jgi:hypothetical protein
VIARLGSLWSRWEAFWDEREHPIALALVRILLGACLLYDFLHLWRLGLVIPLFGVAAAGGFSDALLRENTPWIYVLLPGAAWVARLHHTIIVLAAATLTAGFWTRTSAAVLVFAWAQFAAVEPYSDRGIDTLARLALCILAVSGAGETLSLDALTRTGRFLGDGRPILSAPRRLVILQLVVMYFGAGMQKIGITWWPMGSFGALYFSLQDPAVAAHDFSFLRRQPFFFSSQVGTAVTMLYQLSYPIVLLLFWWRRHPDRGGPIASLARRWHLEWIWIVLGGVFHLSLAMTMNLGIFPWAMLALYPAWLTPDRWLRFFGSLRAATERAISRAGQP